MTVAGRPFQRRTVDGKKDPLYTLMEQCIDSLIMPSFCYACGYQPLACRDFDEIIDDKIRQCGFVLILL